MRVALSLILLASLAVFAVITDQPAAGDDGGNKLLVDRIADLETRIARLEAALVHRQASPAYSTPTPTYPSLGQPGGSTTEPDPRSSVPKTWKRFQFNGQDIYIVPIDDIDHQNRR